jgi:hypothetical protein
MGCIRIFEVLKAAARMNEIHLPPEEVMIDFEIAAKKAFESVISAKAFFFNYAQ